MSSQEEKIDKIIDSLHKLDTKFTEHTVRQSTKQSQQEQDIEEIKSDMEPIKEHVHQVRFLTKIGAVIGGIVLSVLGIIAATFKGS